MKFGVSICYHTGALELVERILVAVWLAVDESGYEEESERTDVVIQNWNDGVQGLLASMSELQRPDHWLRVMLFKEAVRTASRRGAFVPVPEADAECEKDCARCHERNQRWTAWYVDPQSGIANSPAKIRDRWNGMPESERKAISPRCYEQIEADSLPQAANTVLQAIKFHMGEAWKERKKSQNH